MLLRLPLARPHPLPPSCNWRCLAALVVTIAACSADPTRPLRPAPGPARGQVEIHAPPRLAGLATPIANPAAPARPNVACKICHSLRQPDGLPQRASELSKFHQSLVFAHGALSCGSCHLVGDQTALRRADGTAIPMTAAMELCRQCHGPQARDYDHGAHGGMAGHWDLSAGDRSRNHCVDCHDAHAPQILPVQPVLPPRDRGLTRTDAAGSPTTKGPSR